MNRKESVMKSTVAYERIRNLILQGHKLPGSHLVIADLEEELNIGRGPIRDALMRLDRNGLITLHPYKGAIVEAPPSLDELRHIYDIRIHLETTLATDAMNHLTEKNYRRLETILDKSSTISPEQFVDVDKEFHYTIYRASKFTHLCLLASKIFDSVELLLQAYPPSREICMASFNEHKTIVEAMKTNNAELLQQTLRSNIQKRGLETLYDGYHKYGLHSSE